MLDVKVVDFSCMEEMISVIRSRRMTKIRSTSFVHMPRSLSVDERCIRLVDVSEGICSYSIVLSEVESRDEELW